MFFFFPGDPAATLFPGGKLQAGQGWERQLCRSGPWCGCGQRSGTPGGRSWRLPATPGSAHGSRSCAPPARHPRPAAPPGVQEGPEETRRRRFPPSRKLSIDGAGGGALNQDAKQLLYILITSG